MSNLMRLSIPANVWSIVQELDELLEGYDIQTIAFYNGRESGILIFQRSLDDAKRDEGFVIHCECITSEVVLTDFESDLIDGSVTLNHVNNLRGREGIINHIYTAFTGGGQ